MTPTYNRADLIARLYNSLVSQSNKNFIWIVIDDGSDDGTKGLIKKYIEQEKIEIRYFKKNNGGKAAALNFGFRNNEDIDFFAIVDSDDWLYENAIDTITEKAKKYEDEGCVGAVFFKYSDKDGNPLYDPSLNCLKEERCMTRYDHDYEFIKEDGCIGYFKRAVKKYKYPEFPPEKYVGPIVIQMMMAKDFKIAFTQNFVGCAEYQPGGISRSGRGLRLKSPLGMITYCGLLQSERNKSKRSRLKYCIEAQAYASVAKVSKRDLFENEIAPDYLKSWAKFPGMLLGIIWKRK